MHMYYISICIICISICIYVHMYISIHINIHTYMSTSLKVNREEQQHQRGARGPGSASVTKAEQLPPAPSAPEADAA